MIQNEASFVRSGASFETRRLRRRSLRREEVVGSYNIGSLRDRTEPRIEFSHLRKNFAPLEGAPGVCAGVDLTAEDGSNEVGALRKWR